jgi:DNA-binding transcriptional LysR family regulator
MRGTGILATLLGSGELDIAVMRQFPGFPLAPQAGVEQRLLLREPIFIGVSVRHPLAARKEAGLADLAGEQWVIPDADDSGMNTYLARTCAAAGFDQRVSHLTSEAHVAFAFAAARRGICLLCPIGTMREGLAALSLTGTPCTGNWFSRGGWTHRSLPWFPPCASRPRRATSASSRRHGSTATGGTRAARRSRCLEQRRPGPVTGLRGRP